MEQLELRRYAELLVGGCLGLERGGRLRISGEACHRPLMLAVADAAYRAGARDVKFVIPDPALTRLRADLAADEWLDDLPLGLERECATYVEEGWSTLSIVGEEDPKALEGADAGRMQRISRARSTATTAFRQAMMSNRLAWCVAPAPTGAWASAIFEAAGRDAGPDPAAALWEVLVPILRLDAADPAAAARAHGRELMERAARLDALSLASLRFTGPGTDLHVGLSPRSRWIGGGSVRPDGHAFLPNHPTEEVFTSPDARLTSGRAACTRPLNILGAKVEGAWFEFEEGRVTRFGAARNEASLGRYLDTDPGARRLGEVALVDATGPIFRSGLIFGNSLIDENAACHIALGAAYDEAFEGSGAMDAAAREAAGFNESMVHEDFMIGSPEVEVRGVPAGGKEVTILKDGRFTLG